MKKNITVICSFCWLLASLPQLALGQSGEQESRARLFDMLLVFNASKDAAEKNRILEAIVREACQSRFYSVRDGIANKLQGIPREYFSEQGRAVLREALNDDALVTKSIVFLIGYLDLQDERERLEELAGWGDESGRYYTKVSWAAQMTLGRFGDQARSAAIIRAVAEETDILLKVTLLAEHLAYLNSREALLPLLEILYTDHGYTGDIVVDDNGMVGFDTVYYHYYVCDLFRQKTEGFPPRGTPIETIRAWASAGARFEVREDVYVRVREY
jgi:hypothetical protein